MSSQPDLPAAARDRLVPPVAVVLGSPRPMARAVADLGVSEVTCYQMDLYQADRLEEELRQNASSARVTTAPDLWDLPADFQSVLYPAPRGGERALKLDLVEQAFHVLRPHGTLVVVSPYARDQFFPGVLKKVFGKVHTAADRSETVFWCRRERERPRRRHEVTFDAAVGSDPPLRFLSRPGVFSYGRLDDGARALIEVMEIHAGDRILDVGCGCGTNGTFAALRSGPDGSVVFVDSNLRAIALADHNARANAVAHFQTVASARVDGLADTTFDVALANPPYYAQAAIARLFIERSHTLLKPSGRLYLVTRQADQVAPIIEETFGGAEALSRRGYIVFRTQKGDRTEYNAGVPSPPEADA
jgi:16S rRNA G1207 methylase RsmC